jgi:hypothetical protein
VLDPLNYFWQAGEDIDDSQDEDPVTDSDPETVKIVENRVIRFDQTADDQDQPHEQLGGRVVDEALERVGDSSQLTRPSRGRIDIHL